MAKRQRDPEREAFWRESLARQRQSGLSVRAWCSQEGVTETTFYYWQRAIAQRDRENDSAAAGTPAFVPLVLTQVTGDARPERIVLRLRGGRRMRLPAGMEVGLVAQLVHAIEGSSDREGAA
jgi:transposase